jgi:hypothetical protein
MPKKVPSEQMSLLELMLLGTAKAQTEPPSIFTSTLQVDVADQDVPSTPVSDNTAPPLTSGQTLQSEAMLPAPELVIEAVASPLLTAVSSDGAVVLLEPVATSKSDDNGKILTLSLSSEDRAVLRDEEDENKSEGGVPNKLGRDLGAELLDHGAASELAGLLAEERTKIQAVLREAAELLLARNVGGDVYDVAVRIAFKHRPDGELLRLMGKAGVNRLSLLTAWPKELPVTAQGRTAELYQEWVATRVDGAVAAIRPGYYRDRAGGLMPHTELACVAWLLAEERYVRTANLRLSRVSDCKREFLTRGFASSKETYVSAPEAVGLLQRWSSGRAYREISGTWRVDPDGRIIWFLDWHAKNYMAARRAEFTAQMQRLGYRCYGEDGRILMIPQNAGDRVVAGAA